MVVVEAVDDDESLSEGCRDRRRRFRWIVAQSESMGSGEEQMGGGGV